MRRLWIPVLLWLAVIACESTTLSSSQTSRFLLPLLQALLPDRSPEQLTFLHAVLRKAGHFLGYSILSLLLYRAWWGTIVLQAKASVLRRVPGWRAMLAGWSLQAAVLAWLGTVLVAALDELQQSLHQNRGASPQDVLLDSAGGWFVRCWLPVLPGCAMRERAGLPARGPGSEAQQEY